MICCYAVFETLVSAGLPVSRLSPINEDVRRENRTCLLNVRDRVGRPSSYMSERSASLEISRFWRFQHTMSTILITQNQSIISRNGGGRRAAHRRVRFSRASSRRALKAHLRARTNDEILPSILLVDRRSIEFGPLGMNK